MIEKYKIRWVYAISLLFLILSVGLILKEYFFISLLIPVGLIIVLLYLLALDKLILLIVFLTPLAINVNNLEMGVGISLPTEPLLFGVLVLFILKSLYSNPIDKRIVRHPVSIFIIINLIWIFFTSLTSEIPLVSFKFFLARLWFVIPMYFIGIMIFKNLANTKLFIWLYIIPLLIVIGYTIFTHAQYGFDEETGHWVMTPFFNDHTAYGAIIALFVPIVTGMTFDKSYSKTMRMASLFVTLVLLVALILSFSRAAWISLALGLIVYIIIRLRIKFRYILLTFGLVIGIFLTFKWEILDALEKNKQDSSADMIEHVQSIANISSDASNLERINRWQSAIRMYKERPVFGWGPGTYQFLYAPFQRTKEKTIISTNFGDMGNAHSEYIGPMAESGLPGMLSIVALVIAVIVTGLRVSKKGKTKEIRLVAISVVIALVTYFIHGLLNNFLDTDKASVPIWGLVAIIVALDLYHSKEEDDCPAEEETDKVK